MRGMNANTGRAIEGDAHLGQSIGDILGTPIGSRVMRRNYGSTVPYLIDQPFNAASRIHLYAATAAALMRWEPRIHVMQVGMALGDTPGTVIVTISGMRTDIDPPAPASIRFPLKTTT